MKSMLRILFLPLVGFASAAQANYACVGTVIVSTSRGETLVAEFSYSPNASTYLCKLTEPVHGISPDQCKSVYAMLMAAQLSGRNVQMWYNDNLTCSTQPSWTWTTGWYHGPQLLD